MDEKYIRKLIKESIEQIDEGRLTTSSLDIMGQISRNVPGMKALEMKSMFDGMAGLFRYEKDGNAYEIQIRPASSIKDKSLWGKILQPKESPVKKLYRDLNFNKP